MSQILRVALAAAATALTLAAPTAHAGGIDPNTFIVGHPASPRWTTPSHAHAGQEHPAVQVARLGQHLDPNQYRVGPPASTHWSVTPQTPALVQAQVQVAEATQR